MPVTRTGTVIPRLAVLLTDSCRLAHDRPVSLERWVCKRVLHISIRNKIGKFIEITCEKWTCFKPTSPERRFMAPCNALLVVRFENPAPHPQLSKGGAAKDHLETFHKCLHQSIPQLGGHVLTAVHAIIRTSDYPFQSGWQDKVLLVQFESKCPKQEAKLVLCSSSCIGRVKLGHATSQQARYWSLQHAPAEKLHHHLWLLRHPVEGFSKKRHLFLQQSFVRINVSWQVRNGYFNRSRIIGFLKTHRGYSDSRVQPPTNEMQKSGWSSMINGIQSLMSSTKNGSWIKLRLQRIEHFEHLAFLEGNPEEIATTATKLL